MSSRFLVPLALFLTIPAQALSEDTPPANGSPTAESILSELHAANLTEIQEGKLAQDKGVSAKTKKYGKMLVTDHTAADKMVKEAGRLNITLSDTLPGAQQAEVDDLNASSDFNSSFARDEAAGHAKVIADARAARKSVADKGVDKLIGKLLPKLEKHEKDAERLQKDAKKS